MNLYKKLESKNYILEIGYDEYADSPREWDNLGTILGYWRNTHGVVDVELNGGYGSMEEEFKDRIGDFENFITLPVYGFEHSGKAVSTVGFHCRWDSGQVGYIYISKEDAEREVLRRKDETDEDFENRIKEILNNEIENLNKWLQGEVYEYQLYKKDIQKARKHIIVELENEGAFDNLSDNEKENLILDELEIFDFERYNCLNFVDSCCGYYNEDSIMEDIECFMTENECFYEI